MQKRIFLIIALILFGCKDNKDKVVDNITSITGKTMGTYYSIKIAQAEVNKKEIKKNIDNILVDINNTFSTYIESSELNLINKQKHNIQIKLSSELNKVLSLVKKIHLETNGAFDPTVGPIVNRWGFGPKKNQTKPTSEEIKKLMENVGAQKFNLLDGNFTKNKSNLYIDLSAIAKGYAVDKIIKYLMKERGLANILVEIGGEVRAHGKKKSGLWVVGIERPSAQLAGGIQKVIPLMDRSVATSGSYRNYLKYGEKVFTHTIDPKTGMPVSHKLVSVTVIEPRCANADALATSLMVMGPKKGLVYAQKEGLLAYFLVKTESGFKELSTKAFDDYLKAKKR